MDVWYSCPLFTGEKKSFEIQTENSRMMCRHLQQVYFTSLNYHKNSKKTITNATSRSSSEIGHVNPWLISSPVFLFFVFILAESLKKYSKSMYTNTKMTKLQSKFLSERNLVWPVDYSTLPYSESLLS
jgi:hypothetical protein